MPAQASSGNWVEIAQSAVCGPSQQTLRRACCLLKLALLLLKLTLSIVSNAYYVTILFWFCPRMCRKTDFCAQLSGNNLQRSDAMRCYSPDWRNPAISTRWLSVRRSLDVETGIHYNREAAGPWGLLQQKLRCRRSSFDVGYCDCCATAAVPVGSRGCSGERKVAVV